MAEDTLIRVVEEREALRAEVARLREAFDISSAAHAQAEAVLATERAAHEATKAELERRTAWSNAEIARLREELEEALHRGDQHIASLSEALAAHEAAKADHENALANCMHVLRERDDARARVAELERIAQIEAQLKELAMACNKTLAAALDQARGLLERAKHGQFRDSHMPDDLDHWLRAHPVPTPAGHCDNCTTEGYALCEHEPAMNELAMAEQNARRASKEAK